LSIEERFWAKVEKRSDGCWEWTACRNEAGYGKFSVARGVWRLAHRVAVELVTGPIGDQAACHRCDRPWCVNPEHIFLGTQTDNHADMVAKRRHTVEETHPQARLTADDARAIRGAAARGESHGSIGDRFGVSRSNVSLIVARRRWAHA